MKKNLFFITIVTLITVTGNAQQRETGTIELTPYIAHASAFFNGDNVNLYNSKNDLAFGIKADYYFNDRWSLRSGINYDPMGARTNIDLNLNYLSIPVNANWHFGSTRKWNLNFGLTPSFLINAKSETGVDLREEVKSFQFGISYGIGYKLEVSDKFSILFDLQALVGLSNINDIEGGIKQMNAISNIGVGGVFKL